MDCFPVPCAPIISTGTELCADSRITVTTARMLGLAASIRGTPGNSLSPGAGVAWPGWKKLSMLDFASGLGGTRIRGFSQQTPDCTVWARRCGNAAPSLKNCIVLYLQPFTITFRFLL